MRSPPTNPHSPTISLSHSVEGHALRQRDAPYFLVIEQGSSSVFHFPTKPEIVIGRGLDVDLQLQHSSVSRRHLRVFWQQESLFIQDAGSHNGIRLNGVRVEGSQLLHSGDVVSVGDVVLVLYRDSAATSRSPIADIPGLRQHLADELTRAQRYQHSVALVYLDLGVSPAEPELLVTTLHQHLRPLDRIARVGNSQYVVVQPDLDEEERHELTARLLRELPAQTRVGYSICPTDGCDPDTLLLLARQSAAAAAPGKIASPSALALRRKIGEHEILIADPAMLRLYDLIARLSQSPIPVLIVGETGCGKELAAAALHHESNRRAKRMLAINCAALPESLAESELFGHERGAFSGATSAKIGLLESAQGGTVFLDEIGELSLSTQAKLLRALETRRIMRVGDVQERSIDVRLVAATHRNLELEARAGRFRQDLYFRLAAAIVSLPPLRHRQIELPMLARCFLQEARRRMAQSELVLSDAVMTRLLSYPWPGNVRELKNDMEFLAATVNLGPVETWNLPPKLGGPSYLASDGRSGDEDERTIRKEAVSAFRPLEVEIRELERKRITEALAAAEGVQTRAAELLGMPRRTFFAKTKQYGLTPRSGADQTKPVTPFTNVS